MRAYAELGKPFGRRQRQCSIQFGWQPWFTFEAWLDTGYEATRFEYMFGVSIGPWRVAFDWRPAAGEGR